VAQAHSRVRSICHVYGHQDGGDPAVGAALRGAWQVVDPLRFFPGHGHPAAPLAELLALAPPELA